MAGLKDTMEIVFVSSDKDQGTFDECAAPPAPCLAHTEALLPWLCPPAHGAVGMQVEPLV